MGGMAGRVKQQIKFFLMQKVLVQSQVFFYSFAMSNTSTKSPIKALQEEQNYTNYLLREMPWNDKAFEINAEKIRSLKKAILEIDPTAVEFF
jgi:hypothetical protein